MKSPKFKEVTIYDYSHYESSMSANGGSYGFWETYTPTSSDTYAKTYHTTAEFSYCEFCGQFQRGDCGCGHYRETVTEKELLVLIRDANSDKSDDIYSEVIPWELDLKKLRRRIEDKLRKTDRYDYTENILNKRLDTFTRKYLSLQHTKAGKKSKNRRKR